MGGIKVKPNLIKLKGKYHCTANLLFILFVFSCIGYIELATKFIVWSNPNQTNKRSAMLSVLCLKDWFKSCNHCRGKWRFCFCIFSIWRSFLVNTILIIFSFSTAKKMCKSILKKNCLYKSLYHRRTKINLIFLNGMTLLLATCWVL